MAKILIIEDDALLSRMYHIVFTSSKFNVEVAQNGEEGFSKALSFFPDLILLDIMMPKLNGLEVLKLLKANAQTQTIPVVVLTNLAGSGDVKAALDLGAVRYIVKSENKPQQVHDIVAGILAGAVRKDTPES
jgi:DNA-binding response OmpR family regulator